MQCFHLPISYLCARLKHLLVLSLTLLGFQITALAQAPYFPANKPVTDEMGRIKVIIDFADDAYRHYPGNLSKLPQPREKEYQETIALFFHHPQVEAMVADYENRYGLHASGMTSWVGVSMTAFVDTDQLERIRSDSLVKAIYEDSTSELSATWSDSYGTGSNSSELISWGTTAVNGKIRAVNNSRKVYIVDTGVAYHQDLTSVVDRRNVACGNGNCHLTSPGWFPVVGCFPHATHVAGIIGAAANNNKGTRGVYAGMPMVSLSILQVSGSGAICAEVNPDTGGTDISDSAVGYALDYVYWDSVVNNPSSLVNIVNLSLNHGGVYWGGPNWSKVKTLSTPGYVAAYGKAYSGVVIVQSAGNDDNHGSTCANNIYGPGGVYQGRHFIPNSPISGYLWEDGVLVVGALSANDTRAKPFTASVPAGQTNSGPGSNYGGCVDIFAPGNSIYSAWGAISPTKTVTGTTYANIASISGTSMAAPHVAAAAAYYADQCGLNTPGAIETRIHMSKRSVSGGLHSVYLSNSCW